MIGGDNVDPACGQALPELGHLGWRAQRRVYLQTTALALHVVLGEPQVVRARLDRHLQAFCGIGTGQVHRAAEAQVAQVKRGLRLVCVLERRQHGLGLAHRRSRPAVGEWRGITRLPGTCHEGLDYLLVLGVHARDASVLPDRRENLEELIVGNAWEAVGVGAEQRELEPDGTGLDERADVGATGSGAHRAQQGDVDNRLSHDLVALGCQYLRAHDGCRDVVGHVDHGRHAAGGGGGGEGSDAFGGRAARMDVAVDRAGEQIGGSDVDQPRGRAGGRFAFAHLDDAPPGYADLTADRLAGAFDHPPGDREVYRRASRGQPTTSAAAGAEAKLRGHPVQHEPEHRVDVEPCTWRRHVNRRDLRAQAPRTRWLFVRSTPLENGAPRKKGAWSRCPASFWL